MSEQKDVIDKIFAKGFHPTEDKEASVKLSIFDKLDRIFTKETLTQDELGNDLFMMLRLISMREDYVDTANEIQKYVGVLGHRTFILMQYAFGYGEKTPWLDFVKQEDTYKRFNAASIERLKKLFMVSDKRLEEYLPNLYVTDEELDEVYGVEEGKGKKKK